MGFEEVGWYVGGLMGGLGGGIAKGAEGAVLGGGTGAIAGAGVGAVVGTPTGPGAVITVPSGAAVGAAGGAVIGGSYGAVSGVRSGVQAGSGYGSQAGRWLDQQILNMTKGEEEAAAQSNAENPADCVGECQPGYLGTQDRRARDRNGRRNSGPLDPSKGGTGDAEKDFDIITGGDHRAPRLDESYPSGSRIGPNRELFRPSHGSSGPRIDIPASGNKLHETLHY